MSLHFWVSALFRPNLYRTTNLLLPLLACAEMVLDLELSVPEVKVHESLHFSELLWQHNAAVHVPGIQVCLDKVKGTMKKCITWNLFWRTGRAFVQRHYQTPFFLIPKYQKGKEYNFCNSFFSLRKGTPTLAVLMLKLVNHFSVKSKNSSM